LIAVIVAGGVIDLFPIKNERMYQVGVDGDPLYEWVRTETRPSDVFLTDFYVVHGILLAGRKIYLGWPYYAWSAGYDVNQRQAWYRDVFAMRSAREVARALQVAGIDYVAFDDALRDRGYANRLNEELFQADFDMVFGDPDNHYGHLAIYRVPTDPVATDALPGAPPEDMYVGGAGDAPGLFGAPNGVALDRMGAVYVADTGNDRVQKFSSDGNLLQTFDGTTPGEGAFGAPTGVAITSNGSIVIAASDRLVVLDPNGAFDRDLATPEVVDPNWVDVAIDRADTIYALDAAGGQVAAFAFDGSTFTFGAPGSNDAELQSPTGLAVGGGTVAVADAGNARVELFDDRGEFLGTLPVGEWQDTPVPEADVAIDDDGTVWASSPATNTIVVYAPDGTLAGSLAGDAGGQLDRPSGLALRPGGSLFVANAGGNRVSLLGSIHP
jgi:streptogramin lyase